MSIAGRGKPRSQLRRSGTKHVAPLKLFGWVYFAINIPPPAGLVLHTGKLTPKRLAKMPVLQYLVPFALVFEHDLPE
jgi:hypothetical protein